MQNESRLSPLLGAIDTLYKCRKLMVLAPVIGSLLHPVWLRNQSFRHEGEDVKAVERDGWAEPQVVSVSLAQKPKRFEVKNERSSARLGRATHEPSVTKTAEKDDATQRLVILQKQIVAACLIKEAGGEKDPVRAMTGVMNVIENRALHQPEYFYRVVTVPLQFSCFNGVKNDTPENFLPQISEAAKHPRWADACHLVELACLGQLKDITHGATHYLNPTTATDKSWQHQLKDVTKIGRHMYGQGPLSNYLRGLKKAPLLSAEAFQRSGPKRTIEPEGLR